MTIEELALLFSIQFDVKSSETTITRVTTAKLDCILRNSYLSNNIHCAERESKLLLALLSHCRDLRAQANPGQV